MAEASAGSLFVELSGFEVQFFGDPSLVLWPPVVRTAAAARIWSALARYASASVFSLTFILGQGLCVELFYLMPVLTRVARREKLLDDPAERVCATSPGPHTGP